MKRHIAVVLLVAGLGTFCQAQPSGQAVTVWEIGKLDQSSHEFHARPSDHVVYEVGKSNWEQDWPGQEQIGATYEVRFDLDSAPQGVYSLKISLLMRYLNPDLQIEVNGHKGTYYLRTQTLYTGDSSQGTGCA